MKRGIIAAPGKIQLTMTGITFQPSLTAEDVRFYLLYWDKIIIPTNNLIHCSISDEEDLISSGVVWRPRKQHVGRFHGNEIGKAIIEGQCEIADLFLKDKSTDWIIHQIGNEMYFPDELCESNNTIRVNLANALPVPGNNVNINEILEFKERRADELEALRASLDDVYLEVLDSPDPSLTSKKAISELSTNIENLNRVSNEGYNVSKKFDLSAELSFSGKDASIAAAAGAFVDLASGFTIPIATTISAIASTLKVRGKSTKTFKHAKKDSPLGYLSQASSESIINENS